MEAQGRIGGRPATTGPERRLRPPLERAGPPFSASAYWAK